MFTSSHDFLTVNELLITTSVSSVITDHMSSMLQFSSKYFLNLKYNFLFHIQWAAKEQFIKIRESLALKTKFNEPERTEFWLR